jgi:hypothetical protein
VEASRALQNRLNPSLYAKLSEIYKRVEDPARRKDIALMFGKIEGTSIADIKQKQESETNEEAKEALSVAAAKLGDSNSRREFIEHLRTAKDRDLMRYLDYTEYIRQTWAIKALMPVLSNKEPLLRIGIDGAPEVGPEYLRACDLAVNLIVKLANPRFSFTVGGAINYADDQLREAQGFLNSIN